MSDEQPETRWAKVKISDFKAWWVGNGGKSADIPEGWKIHPILVERYDHSLFEWREVSDDPFFFAEAFLEFCDETYVVCVCPWSMTVRGCECGAQPKYKIPR